MELSGLLDRMSTRELRDLREQTVDVLRRKQIEKDWVVYEPADELVDAPAEGEGRCCGGKGCC